MSEIITYQKIDKNDDKESFSISRMSESYQKRKGNESIPHRHNFFTVLIVNNAKGKHVIDFKSYPLEKGQIYFVNPGQVHHVIEHDEPSGYAITFSNDFLAHNNIPLNFISDLNLFQDFGDCPPLLANDEELTKINSFAEQMIEVKGEGNAYMYQSLGALLKLLLIQCNNLCNLDKNDNPMDTSHSLLQKYKTLLNEKYKQWHGVNEYANELNVSSDYLNRVIKNLTGKTAKEHIQNRIILAAKRMIFFSDYSTKELSFELGFSEPANFSAFFKKCTGFSPSEFKKQAEVGNS